MITMHEAGAPAVIAPGCGGGMDFDAVTPLEPEMDGVDWSQRYGAKCPRCGVYTKASYKHASWKDGLKTRYHVCPDPACGHRFQSVADDPASRGVHPSEEQLRYLRDYRGKGGGASGQWRG